MKAYQKEKCKLQTQFIIQNFWIKYCIDDRHLSPCFACDTWLLSTCNDIRTIIKAKKSLIKWNKLKQMIIQSIIIIYEIKVMEAYTWKS